MRDKRKDHEMPLRGATLPFGHEAANARSTVSAGLASALMSLGLRTYFFTQHHSTKTLVLWFQKR